MRQNCLEQIKLNGIVVIYKEKDWTSFDVVAKLRGIFHEKRIGHGGTLDPMAEGVLPVFVGKAARACDMLPDETKAYVAGFKLGIATDTLDVTGKILEKKQAFCKKEQVADALQGFVGEIMQVPPMYSAIKINGKKLYDLAREGKTVERQPRKVTVMAIDLLEFDEKTQEGKISVSCKKGTYIRSIIDDLGQKLGCGAVMTTLERTASAGFTKEQAMTISQVESLFETEGEKLLMSVEKAFDDVYNGRVYLSERLTGLYKNGVKLSVGQEGMTVEKGSGRMLAYGFDGEFLGLCCEIDGVIKQVKNFY